MQTALDFTVSHDMGEMARAVWQVLRTHEGPECAIKAELVVELAGLSERNVQRGVHELIHVHGKSIGSSMREPFGYYVAVTHEQREEAAKLHRERGLAMLTTASKIMAIDRRELLEQIQTELDAA